MDEQARTFLKAMDRFGGHALAEAERAEQLGLSIPFTVIEVVVRGRPISETFEGPTLRVEAHVSHANTSDVVRIRDKAYQMANGLFHAQPMCADQRVHRVFNAGGWYLGFNAT